MSSIVGCLRLVQYSFVCVCVKQCAAVGLLLSAVELNRIMSLFHAMQTAPSDKRTRTNHVRAARRIGVCPESGIHLPSPTHHIFFIFITGSFAYIADNAKAGIWPFNDYVLWMSWYNVVVFIFGFTWEKHALLATEPEWERDKICFQQALILFYKMSLCSHL